MGRSHARVQREAARNHADERDWMPAAAAVTHISLPSKDDVAISSSISTIFLPRLQRFSFGVNRLNSCASSKLS